MAREARLGVVIDATGAKSGADQTTTALRSIGAEAERTGAKHVRMTNEMREATTKQLESTRLQAIDLKRASDAYDALFKVQERVTDSTRAITLAQMEAIKMNETLTAAQASGAVAVEKHRVEYGLMREQLGTLIGQMTGANSGLVRMGASLGAMGSGNAIMIGALAGVALLGVAYEKLTEHSRKLREETNKAIESLTKLAEAQQNGVGGALAKDIAKGTEELKKLRNELANLREQQAAPKVTGAVGLGMGTVADDGAAKKAEELAKRITELQTKIDAGTLDLRLSMDKANQQYSSDATRQLAALIASHKATAAELTSARARFANLQAMINDSLSTGGDASQRLQMVGDFEALNKALNPSNAKELRTELRAAKDLAKEIAAEFRTTEKALYEINERTRTTNELRIKGLEEGAKAYEKMGAEAKAHQDTFQKTLDDLEHQNDLLGKTTDQQRALNGLYDYASAIAHGATDAQATAYVTLRAHLTDSKAKTEDWAASMQTLLGVVQLLARAFGDVGKLVQSIATGAQSIGVGLKAAGSLKGADGKSVDFGTALTGGGGAAAMTSALGAAGAVVGGVMQIADAFDLFGKHAAEKAAALAKAAVEFNDALDTFTTKSMGTETPITAALKDRKKEYAALYDAWVAQFGSLQAAYKNGYAQLMAMASTYQAGLALIGKQFGTSLDMAFNAATGRDDLVKLAQAQQEYDDRIRSAQALYAQGILTLEEYNAAIAKSKDIFDIVSQSITDAVAAAQAAKDLAAAEKALTQERQRALTVLDVIAREQTLAGQSAEAAATRAQITYAQGLASAQDMLKAGTISQEIFDRIKKLLGDELAATITGFADAAAKAAQDLADATEKLRQSQNDSITQRMVTAYKTLNPALAKHLEDLLKETARSRELADATDDATRARLRELYALEDSADAMGELANTLNAAAEAAKQLSDFSQSLNDDYLRATGHNFDADVLQLQAKRDDRLTFAQKNKLDQSEIDKINAWYDAAFSNLVKSYTSDPSSTSGGAMGAAKALEASTRSMSFSGVSSITSEDAVRLIDVAMSQLVLLREIASNTANGGGNGIRIDVTVQGGMYSGSPQDVGSGIAQAIAPLVDEALGRRVGVDNRLTGNASF